MTAAVYTVTAPSDVNDTIFGNKRVVFRDITSDTGTYSTGGFSVTAADLGLSHVDICVIDGLATSGTSGATANPVGISAYGSGLTLTFQFYELGGTGAAGDPLAEKTNAEANLSNLTFRVMAVGSPATS